MRRAGVTPALLTGSGRSHASARVGPRIRLDQFEMAGVIAPGIIPLVPNDASRLLIGVRARYDVTQLAWTIPPGCTTRVSTMPTPSS